MNADGRELHANNRRLPPWNLYSFAIIGFVLICQILRWPLFPFFIDIYYHLSVMLGFDQAGGYVSHAFWEYAPIGRAHLYPPLLHIIMLDLYKIGLSPIFIARLLNFLIFPLFLISVWFIISKIFEERLAFFSVIIFSAVSSFYLSLTNILPFALVLLFCLWIFYFVEKNKIIAVCLLLALSFYTHTFMSFLSVLVFIFYGVLNREKLKRCLKTIFFAFILAAPFLAYQFNNRQYFYFIDVKENYNLEINFLVYALTFPGIFFIFKRKGAVYFFLALLLGTLPLALTHKMRYLSGQGMISFLFLSALAVDNLYKKIVEGKNKKLLKWPVFIILFLSLFYLLNPILSGTSIYNSKFVDEVAKVIKENSAPDDIIYSNFNYAAGMFSVLSSRATSTAMLSEIRPLGQFDQIGASKLIVWVKEVEGKKSAQLSELVKKYKLEEVAETPLTYIYNNTNALGKKIVPKPTIPLYIINLILLIITAAIIYDLLRKKIS